MTQLPELLIEPVATPADDDHDWCPKCQRRMTHDGWQVLFRDGRLQILCDPCGNRAGYPQRVGATARTYTGKDTRKEADDYIRTEVSPLLVELATLAIEVGYMPTVNGLREARETMNGLIDAALAGAAGPFASIPKREFHSVKLCSLAAVFGPASHTPPEATGPESVKWYIGYPAKTTN